MYVTSEQGFANTWVVGNFRKQRPYVPGYSERILVHKIAVERATAACDARLAMLIAEAKESSEDSQPVNPDRH